MALFARLPRKAIGTPSVMSRDDENQFRPRPGRIRSKERAGEKTQSFFSRVRKLARQQSVRPLGNGLMPSAVGLRQGALVPGKATGKGVKRGRGAAFVRARGLGAGWNHRQPGARRVVVKARSVIAAGRKGSAAAHLRYIQRDGTSRVGGRGELYSAVEDRADGEVFLDRGKDDRHQFRFIVAPEDSIQLRDLTGFTRDLMRQVEADLGTKLDWVAVNHHNTGHPHVHVIVNGRDEVGDNLVINGDYIAHGIRERASELLTLELGPVTEIEHQRKLAAEIDQDRFTRIDRALVAESHEGLLDLRSVPSDPRHVTDRNLKLNRLAKLERLGLATEEEQGCWAISDKLEPVLRELGTRGDIIKAIHQSLKAEGQARDPGSFELHDRPPATPVTGRLIDKQLADELGENLALTIDGIDGRVHRVTGVSPAEVETVPIGSIVVAGPTPLTARPVDRAISAMAEKGIYRPSRHLEQARFDGCVPNGDHQGFIDVHVRRLEALRRANIVERIDQDHWRIPDDFETKAAAHDAARKPSVSLRILSTFDLEAQIDATGVTWLDQRLVSQGRSDIVDSGFGAKALAAMDRRRDHLIEQGDAVRNMEGRISYRQNLLVFLERQEIVEVGSKLAASRAVPFRQAGEGEKIKGTFKETVHLVSGKFALIENAHEFTLVPWRPVIDRHIGQEIAGIVQGRSVSWQFGRSLGIGLCGSGRYIRDCPIETSSAL